MFHAMNKESTSAAARLETILGHVQPEQSHARPALGNHQPDLPTFRYKPLADNASLRLLALLPSSHGQSLAGRIVCFSLSAKPIYEAVSYAWGSNRLSHALRVVDEDRSLSITASLNSALHGLRLQDRERLLWVDAICINQQDEAEKCVQVQKMRNIYACAVGVIVWLGDETMQCDGRRAFQALKRLDRTWQSRSRLAVPRLGWKKLKSGVIRSGTSAVPTLTLRNEAHIDALLALPWFRRTWVVQEVAAGHMVTLQLGKAALDWTMIRCIFADCHDQRLIPTRLRNPFSRHACDSIATMELTRRALRSGLQQHGSVSLYDLLVDTRGSLTSDSRDKVYALLGMADDYLRSGDLQVDYSPSCTSQLVYTSVTFWDMRTQRSLRMLASVNGHADYQREHGWPSWVPDWAMNTDVVPFARVQHLSGFRASAEQWMPINLTVNCGLQVSGKLFDKVERLGASPNFFRMTGTFEINEATLDNIAALRSWIRECRSIAADTFDDAFDSFARTMLCGLTASGSQISTELLAVFRRYLDLVETAPELFFEYLKESTLEGLQSMEDPRWDFADLTTVELSISRWASQRRFARTRSGRLAFVPVEARIDDFVAVLYGSQVPMILRGRSDGTFAVLGDSYVDGVMHGEIVASGTAHLRDIVLR